MQLDASECKLAKLDALRCSMPTEQACTELMNEYSTLVRLATDFEQRALMWWNLEPPGECRERVIVPTTEK